jgi:butyryl-CoA dehydrogenase
MTQTLFDDRDVEFLLYDAFDAEALCRLPYFQDHSRQLNSIHEGTSGIQSLDLLGRKVIKTEARSIALLREEVEATVARARAAGVSEESCQAVSGALAELYALSRVLVALAGTDAEASVRHSADFMQALSIAVVGWMWLLSAAVAEERLRRADADRDHCEGKRCAAEYWFRTELPRVQALSALCRVNEDSYARIRPEWF